MSSRSRKAEGVTLGQQVLMDNLLRSCPRRFIDACRKATVYSLGCVPAVERLRESDPLRYAMLVAEAEAQGFPV